MMFDNIIAFLRKLFTDGKKKTFLINVEKIIKHFVIFLKSVFEVAFMTRHNFVTYICLMTKFKIEGGGLLQGIINKVT